MKEVDLLTWLQGESLEHLGTTGEIVQPAHGWEVGRPDLVIEWAGAVIIAETKIIKSISDILKGLGQLIAYRHQAVEDIAGKMVMGVLVHVGSINETLIECFKQQGLVCLQVDCDLKWVDKSLVDLANAMILEGCCT